MASQDWWPRAAREWPEEDRALLARLRPDRLPAHVAVIMDGNGRWARQHGFRDRNRGHKAAIEAVRAAVRTCAQFRLKALTLFAFSTENWRRPVHEVHFLMRLLGKFLVDERPELMENNVRLEMIGMTDRIPAQPRRHLEETRRLTAANTGLVLTLALNYGGRDDIVRAVQKAVGLAKAGKLSADQIEEATIDGLLDTAGMPDPDLLIRTSGEMRISNFLLWQIAYTELYVTPILWPDFRRKDLLEALVEFQQRERRFGRVSNPNAARAAQE
jgi:undecaprenyl diphosphate synthase